MAFLPYRSRRDVLRAFTAGVLCASVGCSRSNDQKAAGNGRFGQVKLALNWVPEPEFGGFYAGRENGAYKRAGIDIEIRGGGAGVPVLQMVATGEADFGVVGADEVINGNARGADVVPVFATFQTFPQAIMVHASRGAKNLADVLTSGTIAIEPGAPYATFLKKKYGFGKANLLPYDGGVAKFLADENHAQQCFATSEPIEIERNGKKAQVFLIADEGYNPYTVVVIVRRALWEKNPDLVRAFVRASREGWRAYLDDPTAANAVMAKLNTTLAAESWNLVAAAQKRFIEPSEAERDHLGKMTLERWETLTKQLVELDIVKDPKAPSTYLVKLEN
ncbi:MAG: ABC transporter substrate-binding protein [Polyangiaceae bacterium]|nr:ABC transporter substrate-binding protein [Polyangiaceae bacterium]